MNGAIYRNLASWVATFAAMSIFAVSAFGHCDTMQGPVVKAAQNALRTRNVNHILIWVHEKEDGSVREAFKRALKVRGLGRDARDLADMYFFETVVRLHRAGEGEPYTGLKASASEDLALFNEIDKAIGRNSISTLLARFPSDERVEIEKGFGEVIGKKKFRANDVAAGRRFVESYVKFLHLVEKIEGHSEG